MLAKLLSLFVPPTSVKVFVLQALSRHSTGSFALVQNSRTGTPMSHAQALAQIKRAIASVCIIPDALGRAPTVRSAMGLVLTTFRGPHSLCLLSTPREDLTPSQVL